MEEDPELERKAVEELLKEAKRGRTRAETMGAMGCLMPKACQGMGQTRVTCSSEQWQIIGVWLGQGSVKVVGGKDCQEGFRKRKTVDIGIGMVIYPELKLLEYFRRQRLKCPLAGTNKRFLINTIKNTLPSQKEQEQEREQKEDDKESEPNKSRKEEKPKKRRIHPYTPSFQSRRRVSYSPPRHRSRNQHTKDKHEKRSSRR
ncbi:hypothetical protein DUI87_16715 [Hirundo rustica rustica]|uniref:Uncharacterized protein n=1 Tax=Hirundo rustica rustica TaxID=333673 RepID=A0A3M0K2L1_HIRRU|nr:hypothetical protein DUI87_16715 [Hirundo rustica rustica]